MQCCTACTASCCIWVLCVGPGSGIKAWWLTVPPLHTRLPCRNKLVQITYALANVYDDSPNLDVLVTEEHRARAEDMMACVESGDVTRLRDSFLEVRGGGGGGKVWPFFWGPLSDSCTR